MYWYNSLRRLNFLLLVETWKVLLEFCSWIFAENVSRKLFGMRSPQTGQCVAARLTTKSQCRYETNVVLREDAQKVIYPSILTVLINM